MAHRKLVERMNFKSQIQNYSKMNLIGFLFIRFICLTYDSNAQHTGRSYTLQQSLEIALANNIQVKQSGLQSEAAAIALRQARSNLLPGFSATINHGANQGRSIDPFTNGYVNQNVNYANYSLNSGIVLFNGLIQKNLVKQTLLSYQARKMDQQQAKDDLSLNVMYTYFQILSSEDQMNQAQIQKELTQKQVERSKLLSKEGAIAPSQLSDLMGQLANDELLLISYKNSLNAYRIALIQLMNVPHNADFKLERLPIDVLSQTDDWDPDKIYASALEKLALIKSAIFRRESAVKGIQVARGGYYPQLSLNGNIFSNYSSAAESSSLIATQYVPTINYVELNGSKLPVFALQQSFENSKIAYSNQIRNNYSTSFSIGLRIPISNALRIRNQVSLAKIEFNEAELAEEATKLQLRQAVNLAWQNMRSANERLQILTNQVQSFKQSFHAAEIRFNAGVGTVVDYTIAKNNFERANISLISAKYDYLLRMKILDYYGGKLNFF